MLACPLDHASRDWLQGHLATPSHNTATTQIPRPLLPRLLLACAAILLIGAVQQVWGKGASGISLDLPLLTDAAFCAASAMIAYGAIIGKATPAELLWLLVTMVRRFVVPVATCQ